MMTSDVKTASADVIDPGISNEEAAHVTREDSQTRLKAFIDALDMRHPVSTHKVTMLIKHIVKDKMAGDPYLIAGQMRIDHWETGLANGDNLDVLSERAAAFFKTKEGIELHNFFTTIFTRTTDATF
jgi:hypothetical protein